MAKKHRSRFLGLAVLAAPGCVFPAHDPTGLEISWRFVELNDNDRILEEQNEDELPPVRTCDGANVDRVVLSIEDAEDEGRSGTFEYECADGFQTPQQSRSEASDAFIELNPGPYLLDIDITDAAGRTERAASRELNVLSRTLTVEALDLARPLVTWPVRLMGASSCTTLEFHLRYFDPVGQLGTPPVDEDGEELSDVTYRQTLLSDRGLSFAGGEFPCAGDLNGVHTVTEVDPGDYRLDIVRDGQACALSVSIEPGGPEFPIDLANLPCGG